MIYQYRVVPKKLWKGRTLGRGGAQARLFWKQVLRYQLTHVVQPVGHFLVGFWGPSPFGASVAATPIFLPKIGFFQKNSIKIMICQHQSIDEKSIFWCSFLRVWDLKTRPKLHLKNLILKFSGLNHLNWANGCLYLRVACWILIIIYSLNKPF